MTVIFNNQEYKICEYWTSSELYKNFGVDPELYDLWKIKTGERDSTLIPNNETVTVIREGEEIFTSLKQINS